MAPNQGIHLPLVSMRQVEFVLGKSREDLRKIASYAGRYYHPFDRRREIGKGKWRHIDNPKGELKLLQKRIQKHILSKINLPDTMVGGIPGRSIRANAKIHEGQQRLVTLDLKNCFPRTTDLKVFEAYRKILKCSSEIASLLTKLTTFQKRLPQGAPTSSILANFTLLPMHDEICAIAKKFDLRCSIYVDDIAFSGVSAYEAIDEIIYAIQRHGHSQWVGEKQN